MIYLDTSAAVKALIDEAHTADVRRLFAREEPMISSRLLAVELHAAADRRAIDVAQARELIELVTLVSLDDDTLDAAIGLRSGLRTLDALHLAAAHRLGEIVTGVLTFDRELANAVERNGMPLHPLSPR